MARPKSEDPSVLLSVNLKESQVEQIDRLATEGGIKRAAALRQVIGLGLLALANGEPTPANGTYPPKVSVIEPTASGLDPNSGASCREAPPQKPAVVSNHSFDDCLGVVNTALEEGTITRANLKVRKTVLVSKPEDCPHPKASRNQLAYGTWCTDCGKKIN